MNARIMKRPADELWCRRSLLVIGLVGALAACETAPEKPAVPAPAPVLMAPSVPAPAPPTVPEPEPVPAIVLPAAPATPAAQRQAQQAALAAAEMLETGNEEAAKRELQRALALDAQNALAQNLTRQIGTDPVAVHGRESFAYTVRSGETLSLVAERFMKDKYLFYALARYNDIKVPRLVANGQVIRVPGKAPAVVDARPREPRPATPDVAQRPAPPQSTPAPATAAAPQPQPQAQALPPEAPPAPPAAAAPSPGEAAMRKAAAAEKAGNLVQARTEYLIAASHSQPGAAAKAEASRKSLVTQYSTEARRRLARQDLDGALAQWQQALALEPDNAVALREAEHVRYLKAQFSKVK